MKNNKKQKRTQRRLPLILGIGFGLIAAGSVSTLLATIGKTRGDLPHSLSITFDKGTGTEITGNTKIKFKDETCLEKHETPVAKKIVEVQGYKTEYNFVDWVDEEGMTIYPQTSINKTTKLTATYSDELPEGSYYTVSFITLDAEDWLTGITKLSVPKGRTFATINKPQAHSSNNAKKFKGWALSSDPSSLVDPDTPISADLIVTPAFSTDVQFKWHGGDGGQLVSGEETVYTENNVKFSSLNQPVYKNEQTNEKFIIGWYKEDPTGKTEEELETLARWNPSDLIPAKEIVEAWAIWSSLDADKQVQLEFVQNKSTGQPPVVYQGNTKLIANKTDQWQSINRPNPYAAGYVPAKWQYSLDGSTGWTDLLDASTFSEIPAGTIVYIRPVMQQNIDSITIYGPTTLKQTESGEYSAIISPADVETEITWEIFKDKNFAYPIKDGSAWISPSGVLKTTTASPSKIYVRATAKINTDKKASLEVTVVEPTVQSADYFTFDDNTNKWYRLEGLFGADDISFIVLDSSGTTITPEPRATFNRDVYIGDQVRMVQSGFLNKCTAFNSQIKFTSSNTKILGDNFMTGCKSFNQKLDLSNIQHIGNWCLANAVQFNNGATSVATATPLSLTSIITIGDGFLAEQVEGTTAVSAFNCPIAIGSSATTIGKDFLWNACSFNSNINFPASLTDVGDFCMLGCDNFTATITVDADASVFADGDLNFCSSKSDAAIKKPGFIIGGNKCSDFQERFPSKAQVGTSVIPSCYRENKTTKDTSFNTASWSYLISWITKLENNEIDDAKFCAQFTIKDPDTGKDVHPTKISQFVGQSRELYFLNRTHKITVQGTYRDPDELKTTTPGYKVIKYKDKDGNTKPAAFVFGFDDVVTSPDANRRLDMPWSANASKSGTTGNISDTKDYLNSPLRKDVNGAGNGKMYFYSSTGKSSVTKPLIDYMPTEIVDAMKTPINRECYISNDIEWKVYNCPDKFFVPTISELFGNGADGWGADRSGFSWTSIPLWGATVAKAHRTSTTATGGDAHYIWTSSPYVPNRSQASAVYNGGSVAIAAHFLDFSVRPFWAI